MHNKVFQEYFHTSALAGPIIPISLLQVSISSSLHLSRSEGKLDVNFNSQRTKSTAPSSIFQYREKSGHFFCNLRYFSGPVCKQCLNYNLFKSAQRDREVQPRSETGSKLGCGGGEGFFVVVKLYCYTGLHCCPM